MSHPVNQVAGTWTVVSAKADPQGANTDLFGPTPAGQLIFTENLRFTVFLHDPSTPRFASDDRGEGSAEELRAAVRGSLALYGTYTVDEEGRFAGEVVLGCSFPNWTGMRRTTSTLTETVEGERMTEHLRDPGTPLVEIIWQRHP